MNIDKTTNYKEIAKKNEDKSKKDIDRQFYDDFCSKMQKSDFCNSPSRYIAEIELLKNLEENSKKSNNKENLEFYQSQKKIALAALNELGFDIDEI